MKKDKTNAKSIDKKSDKNPQKIRLTNDKILPVVERRLYGLKKILQQKQLKLKNAPEGSIRTQTVNGKSYFYLITEKGDTNGKYLSKENCGIVKKIFQRDYDIKITKELETEIAALEGLKKVYTPENLPAVYEKLSESRKKLVESCVLAQSDFAENWKNEAYEGRKFYEDSKLHVTASGLKVRSKSEVLIAQALEAKCVPFRY